MSSHPTRTHHAWLHFDRRLGFAIKVEPVDCCPGQWPIERRGVATARGAPEMRQRSPIRIRTDVVREYFPLFSRHNGEIRNAFAKRLGQRR